MLISSPYKSIKTLHKGFILYRMFIIGHKTNQMTYTRTTARIAHTHTQAQPRTRRRGRTRRHTHEHRSRPGTPTPTLAPFLHATTHSIYPPPLSVHKKCKDILLSPTPICYNVKKGVPPTNCF